jgi:hypothetical protein
MLHSYIIAEICRAIESLARIERDGNKNKNKDNVKRKL